MYKVCTYNNSRQQKAALEDCALQCHSSLITMMLYEAKGNLNLIYVSHIFAVFNVIYIMCRDLESKSPKNIAEVVGCGSQRVDGERYQI